MLNPLSDTTFKAPQPVIPFTSSNGNSCCGDNSNNVLIIPSPAPGFNVGEIEFATSNDNPAFVLNNYTTLYKSLYGNNPDLALYTLGAGEQGDEGTVPIILRSNPSDINSDIISITWQYPVATTGYVRISGIVPGGGTGPANPGAVPITLKFDQTNLLDAGGGNWYLPLTIPGGKNPIYAFVNNKGFDISNYDRTVVPARMYGFANNTDQQDIEVTIL